MRSAYDLHRSELEALVTIGRGGASSDADDAARNLTNRQPAFWSTEGYSNAVAGSLLYYANRCGGVCAGIIAYNIDFPPECRVHEIDEVRFLDTLAPLNAEAVASLQEAYEINCGTFRGKAELVKRAVDIGFRTMEVAA